MGGSVVLHRSGPENPPECVKEWWAVTDNKSDQPDVVVIKKYANRRLYNTKTSSYVTLDHLCEMVKEGTEFEVKDARTGEDITRSVLTQIIFEEEAKGQNLLPIRFLRQLIGFYGDSLQAFVPGYLDMSMENFTRQQEDMRSRMAQAFGAGPQALEAMTRQNLALFEKTMRMFSPFGAAMGRENEPQQPRSPGNGAAEPKAASADDVNELKSEIETMRRQLAELAKGRG
ncbi:MAG TPA: polyhydroxyalkanoate synthesis repressor PhaR [Acidisoma sp.]|nr:polyhydroxyalkanoate synthesis repressor PhaR [Acidisoma sp.]